MVESERDAGKVSKRMMAYRNHTKKNEEEMKEEGLRRVKGAGNWGEE